MGYRFDKEHLLHVLEESLNEIYMFDAETLRFTYVNKGALLNIGYTMEQMSSMTPLDIKPEFTRELFGEMIRPLRDGSEHKIVFETVHQRADGTLYDCEVHLQLVRDIDSPLFMAIILDITDRKAAEEKIRQLNRNLEKKVEERTRQLESFSYSVSHDLRAPLRAINGYSQILTEEYQSQLSKEGRRILRAMKENSVRMGDLIDDLLEFSRLDRKNLNRMTMQPDRLVKAVLGNLSSAEKERSRITVHPMPEMKADYSLMYQVYQNLISNALKFSASTELPEIEIGASETERGIIYFVKDNGAGFNMDYYDKLFGVFQRLHSEKEFEGTGVGLAIVQRVILRHGGEIWAESEEGKGATFFFTIANSA